MSPLAILLTIAFGLLCADSIHKSIKIRKLRKVCNESAARMGDMILSGKTEFGWPSYYRTNKQFKKHFWAVRKSLDDAYYDTI